MDKVSVIIPTHNRAELLLRAARSVLAQTYPHWELIVVDDGSDDGTEAHFNTWLEDARPEQGISYVKSPRQGVSQARNLGVSHATGQWIAFLDSDDEWLPDKLERQLTLASEFSVIHCGETWLRDGTIVPQLKKHAKSGGRIFNRCVEICCVATSAVLMKRSLFGGFREDFPVCEDYELWLRLSSKNLFGFIDEALVHKHGGRDDQLSVQFKAMDYYRVKALIPFLKSPALSGEERAHVAREILIKAEILLASYLKYPNALRMAEVQGWQAEALAAKGG